MTKPVLMLSEDLDYHGQAVRWGLERLDQPCHWWQRSRYPADATLSVFLPDAGRPQTLSSDSPVSLEPGHYATVWNRRGQAPQASERLAPPDRIVARNEAELCLRGMLAMLECTNPQALIVNGFDAARRANSKVLQLHVARSVGFRVPDTLVSNDPLAIRQFSAKHDGCIVAKQHFPFAWRRKDGALLISATAAVTPAQLAHDASLSGSPMIYQERLEIAEELRLIAFGKSTFAMRQRRRRPSDGNGFVDIRYSPTDRDAVCVEAELQSACFAYMEALGLHYAAFDIARTIAGETLFIEANESGQFLFLEESVSSLPLLDAFCQFLASGDPDFRYETASGITFAEFEATAVSKDFRERFDSHMKKFEKASPFELQDHA